MLILWGNEHLLPISRTPAQAGLRLMGESDPTASQPPKPVCDWSVGPRKSEVKREFTPKHFPLRKSLVIKRLEFSHFLKLRKTQAYGSPVRWSVIMASSSSSVPKRRRYRRIMP